MRVKYANQRGDTIIEVLFAVAVFAMVAVGGMAIMNQGTAIAQRALEVTLVRQQIDAQAEAIRFIHQAYIAGYQANSAPTGTAERWSDMADDRASGGASDFGQLTNNEACPPTVPGESPFVLNARRATLATPSMSPPADGSLPPYAHVTYTSDSAIENTYGIWIEAVPSAGDTGPGFVDFHIRACWDSAGSSVPTTLGTIVRLYEPR